MFENMIHQSACDALAADIQNGSLPPSVLFSGPPSSGKATAALETARVLSCLGNGSWTCACPSCAAHKDLRSKDLLVIGPRPFTAEILACSKAFLRDFETPSAKILFLRSLRKLLLRFSPVVREGESDITKYNSIIEALGDHIDVFSSGAYESAEAAEKIVDTLVKDAVKLEAAGTSDAIPVAHIRRATYWLRLTPDGRRKVLVIENADRMRDEARNSLLKTIEEPPPSAQIILTSAKPRALLPTILSRLRPYPFAVRAPETGADIVRRVFRDSDAALKLLEAGGKSGEGLISDYLEHFLPVHRDTLFPLAALLAMAVSAQALKRGPREEGRELLTALGTACARAAEGAGLDTARREPGVVCKLIFDKAEGFQSRRLFTDFIGALFEQVSAALRESPRVLAAARARELFARACAPAQEAVTVYNQNAQVALERLFARLSEGLAAL